jgi:hypothetical protein
MSTAGEAKLSQGPQGPTPRGMSEADAPALQISPLEQGGRE